MNYIKFKFIVLLCLISVCASAQNIAVKGVVKDTSGEPIIGASVLEKGTTNGIITDLDGNFSLLPSLFVISAVFQLPTLSLVRAGHKASYTCAAF